MSITTVRCPHAMHTAGMSTCISISKQQGFGGGEGGDDDPTFNLHVLVMISRHRRKNPSIYLSIRGEQATVGGWIEHMIVNL
jgi:hypothetical protein